MSTDHGLLDKATGAPSWTTNSRVYAPRWRLKLRQHFVIILYTFFPIHLRAWSSTPAHTPASLLASPFHDASVHVFVPRRPDWIRRVFRECVSDTENFASTALITVALDDGANPAAILDAEKSQLEDCPCGFSRSGSPGTRSISSDVSPAIKRDADVHGGVLVLSDLALLCQHVYYRERRSGRRQRRDADDEDSSNASLYDALRSEDGGESSGGESATDPRVRGEGARGSMSPIGGFVKEERQRTCQGATAASRGEADGAVASSGVLRSALQVDDCEYNGNPQWMQNFGRGVGYGVRFIWAVGYANR